MFTIGNIVMLNSKGHRYWDRKSYRKRILKYRQMIIISFKICSKGKRKWFVRDLYSDMIDTYKESYLQYICKNRTEFIQKYYVSS